MQVVCVPRYDLLFVRTVFGLDVFYVNVRAFASELALICRMPEILHHTNFTEAAQILASEYGAGIALLDLDGTIKSPQVDWFGKVPQESIDQIRFLQESGWTVGVVTNQPKRGHQVARALGYLGRKPFFPNSLTDILGDEAVFGGDLFFWVPGHHCKKNGTADAAVRNFIDLYRADYLFNSENFKVVMIGDKDTDLDFAVRINADIFIRLPDLPYMEKILKLPDKQRNFIMKLIP